MALYPIKQDDKYGFINDNGEVVVQPKYDWAEEYSEGFCRVQNGYKVGFINQKGEEAIPLQYTDAKLFCEGFAIVADKNHKYGFIDTNNKPITEFEYDQNYQYGFREGLALVEKDGKLGYIDTSGKVVIPIEFKKAYDFIGGFALVKKSTAFYYIDQQNNRLGTKRCTYNVRRPGFRDGRAVVLAPNEKYGCLSTDGEWAIDPIYKDIVAFSEGLCGVLLYDKWGFIDVEGNMVIEPRFDRVESFSGGVAPVSLNGKWTLIDTNGKLRADPTFKFIPTFGGFGFDDWIVHPDKKLTQASTGSVIAYINRQAEIVAYKEDPEVKKAKIKEKLIGMMTTAPKQRRVWERAEESTRHVQYVLEWMKSKDLLSPTGQTEFENQDFEFLHRTQVTPEGADFLDRFYQYWFEEKGIINMIIDPSIEFTDRDSLDEYWDFYVEYMQEVDNLD